MTGPAPLLQLRGISKSFGRNQVLSDVSLAVRAGQVHALVGENGAGKSTLMNIIGGIHRPDAGAVLLGGRPVSFAGPLQAIKSGVSIVHQELSLAPNLSVAQNIFSHREPVTRLGFIRWRELYRLAEDILSRMGLHIDVTRPAASFSVAVQQLVEIAKALSQNARILIMDEPTSALSDHEIERLYGIIGDLKSQGVAVVFISHKLGEVLKVADEVSVLRDGLLVGTLPAEQASRDEIIRMMVGRHIDDIYPPKPEGEGGELLSVHGLTREPAFRDVSFTLRRGEILGLAGLVGAGRTEVARAVFGADRPDSGSLLLEGKPALNSSPAEAISRGICYLTEDRKALGLFLKMPVRANITGASRRSFAGAAGMLKHDRIRRESMGYVDELGIRPFDDLAKVVSLSGGNQQKVLLAKWLCAGPKVLIVDEPTRGVDVGAKAQIHRRLRELADQGIGVIVISSELPEVLGLSNRVAVFREGRLAAVLEGDEATQETVMRYATA